MFNSYIFCNFTRSTHSRGDTIYRITFLKLVYCVMVAAGKPDAAEGRQLLKTLNIFIFSAVMETINQEDGDGFNFLSQPILGK